MICLTEPVWSAEKNTGRNSPISPFWRLKHFTGEPVSVGTRHQTCVNSGNIFFLHFEGINCTYFVYIIR